MTLKEELINKYVEAHSECRWMDASELRELLNAFVGELEQDAIERTVKEDAGGYPYIDCNIELYDYDKDIPLAKKGDKVKIVIIHE